jgi:type II secretory pathway component PulK
VVALDDDGSLSFYRTPDTGTGSTVNVSTKVARLPRQRVPLGAGEFSYRISDEEARVNVNTASPDRIERLLTATGLDKQTRDIINDSLQDWKDADDLHRINGAESEDYYLKQPVPYRARNGALQDAAELLQIRGVTREIYRGVQDHGGLADLVTVVGRDTVNMNTAPAPVLTALGLSDAEVTEITSTRARTPYTAVPSRFAGKGWGWVARPSASKRRGVSGVSRGRASSPSSSVRPSWAPPAPPGSRPPCFRGGRASHEAPRRPPPR